MKKYSKILISLFVFTVLISNISYSLTYSICGMMGGSSCSCEMLKDNYNTEIFKKAPCCEVVVKDISNSSDFESRGNIKVFLTPDIIAFTSEYICQKYFIATEIPLRFIFSNTSTDLPVKYSSLLI